MVHLKAIDNILLEVILYRPSKSQAVVSADGANKLGDGG